MESENKKSLFNYSKKYPVVDRIQFVMNKLALNEITAHQKSEIGQLIAKAFFDNPKHLYLTKETIREKEGEVNALVYPAHFVPVMDKIIFDYLKPEIVEPLVKKRKRTSKTVTLPNL